MSLSEHSQAITGSVHYRADLLPRDSLSVAGSFWLLWLYFKLEKKQYVSFSKKKYLVFSIPHNITIHSQPFATSSFPVAAPPSTPDLIVKQKIWNKTQHLMLLPMFCCKSLQWDTLLTVHVSRNICSRSVSSWLALGTVRVQLSLNRTGSKYLIMLQAFTCWKGNPNQAFMASQLLHCARHDHLIETGNLQLVQLLVCPGE